MPALRPTSWQVQERIFLADGFVYVRHQGDHRVYQRPGADRPVVIPESREVPIHVIRNNMKTAGMTRARYFELLEKVR